jgi:ribosome-binding factor A
MYRRNPPALIVIMISSPFFLISERTTFLTGLSSRLDEKAEKSASLTKRAAQGLASAAGFLRRRIAKEFSLRFTPEIEFYYDDTMDVSEKIDDLLAGIKRGAENG